MCEILDGFREKRPVAGKHHVRMAGNQGIAQILAFFARGAIQKAALGAKLHPILAELPDRGQQLVGGLECGGFGVKGMMPYLHPQLRFLRRIEYLHVAERAVIKKLYGLPAPGEDREFLVHALGAHIVADRVRR